MPNLSQASATPSKQRSAVSGSGAPPELRTKRGVPPMAATSEALTATALKPTFSGEAHSLKWWPWVSMSEAATHVLSPIFNTAQSSPTGTITSDGAGGRRAEILRITSCSFNSALCRTLRSGLPQARSSLHLLDGRPEHVRVSLCVPGMQRAPLGFRGPHGGVVGRGLRFYLAPGMACQEAHASVQFGIFGLAPRLYPGPPGVFDAGPYAGLLVQLAAGTGDEILTLLEHTARILPEPGGRLAAPEQQDPRPDVLEIDEHGPGPEVGGNHARVLARQGWRGRSL